MTTLSDCDIQEEMQAGRLIEDGDPKLAEGACYQLRMGNVYYDLTEGAKRFELAHGQRVLIKPGHRVVLITIEKFNVPADILARIVSKGSLFSVGLSPVATYADPGFKGNLGIVTQNVSDTYIELPQGEPVAKVDFTRLTSPAARLYQGQHGFQAGIWPIKTHLQKDHSQVAKDPRVQSETKEALALLPAPTRTIIRQIENTQIIMAIGGVLAIIINAGALYLINSKLVENIYGIIGNLVASAIVALVLLGVNYVMRNR